jgi:nitrate reductase gamma subunit
MKKKVYNLFQINLIVFYVVSFSVIPVFIVIAYLFDLHEYTSTNYIVLIATTIALIFFIVGLTYLLVRRDKLERVLKPSYRKELFAVVVFSGFAILGIGIFYTYLPGGSFFYVPHVIIPLFIGVYALVLFLANKFFNVDFLRK